MRQQYSTEMRVLVIHNRYRLPGGEDVATAADVALLRQAGHDVVLHEVCNPETQLATARALTLVAWNGPARHTLRELIRRVKPDIVHAHNTWFALGPAPLRAVYDADIPLVITIHNYRLVCAAGTLFRDGHVCRECVGTRPWRGVQHRCYRDSAVASFASALTIATHRVAHTWDGVSTFLTPSSFLRDRLVEGGLPGERVRIRSNHTTDPGARSSPPSASRTILFVGRLAREKGADVLVDAWSREAPGDLELLIVGDGPERASLEAMAVPGVRFAGLVPPQAVAELMASARCLVVPSRWPDVQPIVVLEAMAAGLPALVADSGGLPEAVDHEPNFVVTLDAGGGQWSKALIGLSDSIVDESGLRARARYLTRHTPSTALTSLLEVYEQASLHRRP